MTDHTNTPEPSAADMRILKLLRKTGLSGKDAVELYFILRNMASSNLIYRFESKLDAQQSMLKTLQWVLTIGLSFIVLVVSFGVLYQIFGS